MFKSNAFHLGFTKNDLQGVMLAIVPSDLEHVGKIAALVDKPAELASHREFTTWRVKLDGKAMIVCFTGIGSPSISTAIKELTQLDIRTFLRIGTIDAIQSHISVGGVLVITTSVRLGDASLYFASMELLAIMDFECTIALVETTKSTDATTHVGVTAPSNIFCPGQECHGTFSDHVVSRPKGSMEEWQFMGIMNYEVESVTLLAMCASRGLRAGMTAGITMNCTQQEIPNVETMKRTKDHAVKTMVGAARRSP